VREFYDNRVKLFFSTLKDTDSYDRHAQCPSTSSENHKNHKDQRQKNSRPPTPKDTDSYDRHAPLRVAEIIKTIKISVKKNSRPSTLKDTDFLYCPKTFNLSKDGVYLQMIAIQSPDKMQET